MKQISIVGGGLAGLSSAIYLASEGYHVKVFEKNNHFGGKMMAVDLGNYHFDFGPNTITMPHVFRNVLSDAGLNPDDYFTFKQIETHTRNSFGDGFTFDLSSSKTYMLDQLKKLDPKGASKYQAFLNQITKLYSLSDKHFLHRTFESWRDYLSPSLFKAMLNVKPNQSMHEFMSLYFDNPKIIQSLDRYATYIGSNPYIAPATFSMIAYLELIDGVYYIEGGNTKIAEGFERAARELGVELYANHEVNQLNIQDSAVTDVILSDGQTFKTDEVIINGDVLKAYPELVKEEHRPHFSNQKVRDFEPSISAFVILAGLTTRVENLHHHHLFFTKNYQKEFIQLQEGVYPESPTIYISTSSKSDPTVSPDGDNCFILVNAPAIPKDGDIGIDTDEYKQKIYDRLKAFGYDIQPYVKEEQVWTPKDIRKHFGAFRGSIYGPASNKKVDAFRRPYNKSQDISNLYFAGGSTHPGGGSPMVVLSGKNVARSLINKDRETS
ncbi:phytoene desaturase family protein [Pontibacillus yanchengensis]|uniref:4,4'-diaponeurosporene oxygenase n=1 Tax=Pontibacillus yanchengensis Y32 TaxID=1385514 RepID=A0A0A2TSJ4_9BACI|nr:phytoene desaturase family protein [Pontibacillus yanchengensis]KGP72220.1 phytoene desaturase [Pontibacillus yanchengensis Y32]